MFSDRLLEPERAVNVYDGDYSGLPVWHLVSEVLLAGEPIISCPA